jgi:hypothetical protein
MATPQPYITLDDIVEGRGLSRGRRSGEEAEDVKEFTAVFALTEMSDLSIG